MIEKIKAFFKDKAEEKAFKKQIIDECKDELKSEMKEIMKEKIIQDYKDKLSGKSSEARKAKIKEAFSMKALGNTSEKLDRMLGKHTTGQTNNNRVSGINEQVLFGNLKKPNGFINQQPGDSKKIDISNYLSKKKQ
jgi:hypothetical protein